MPKYRIEQLSYIGGTLVQPGHVIDYDGIPSDHMVLVEGKAKVSPAKAVAQLIDSARQAAATRGDDPANANAGDVTAAAEASPGRFSDKGVADAVSALTDSGKASA